MSEYLIGIDNGGTISKVAIFDTSGREIHTSSRKVRADYPQPGWGERPLQAGVWKSTADTIQDAITQSGIAPDKILAVGNSAHGNGIYLLDKSGNPLRPAILSTDTRAAEIVAEWKQNGIADAAWGKIYQQLWAAQPPALLAWLKANEPENYRNIGTILMCKDYIKYCLTGETTTDFSDISASSLLDLNTRDYSDELLKLYAIEEIRHALCPPIESYEQAGAITAEAANLTGLLEGTPVVSGLFDVSATALGAGVIYPGQACIIAGTWSINEVVTAGLVDNKQLFMNSIYTRDTWMAIEASATSASNLEWFVEQWCAEEKIEALERGISVYDVCNEKVARLEPGSTNILFQPFLFGSNVQANARAGFYGIGGWHTRDHVLRAVYEGIVYGHMSHIEKLQASGISMVVARFTGGAARSKVWTQMFADATGIPMEVVEGDEIGTRGAAMCAGIGVGVYSSYHDAVDKAVIVERHHEPNTDFTPIYRARFEEYQCLSQVMQDVWDRLNKL